MVGVHWLTFRDGPLGFLGGGGRGDGWSCLCKNSFVLPVSLRFFFFFLLKRLKSGFHSCRTFFSRRVGLQDFLNYPDI